jgi:hypothetical protein
MAQENIAYSQSLVNLDGLNAATFTTPALATAGMVNQPLANTAGEGAPAGIKQVSDVVTVVSADNTSSQYHFVRIPTNAHVKRVYLYSTGVATAGAADFNVVFSDSIYDGTSTANQGTVPQISAANNKLFGAAQSILAGTLDLTYANIGHFPYGAENEPLWQVLGYATDPGGMFDIVAFVTTAVTTGGTLDLRVDFTVPGA